MPRRRDKGQGGITKRADGRWQGTYYDAQDRLRYVYGKTKRAVQEQLAERQSQVRQGISLEPGRETVASFAERWVRDVKTPNTAYNTSGSYRDKLLHVTRALGKVTLQALTAQQLQRLYSDLIEQGLEPSTVRGVHTVIHAMLGQAVKWNLVVRNVADAATPPRARYFQPQVLSPQEVRHLLAVNHEDRLFRLIAVALTTGLRFGELRALRWERVNTEQGELTVLQSMYSLRGGGWAVKEPKSQRGKRTVILGETAINALNHQRHYQRLQRMAAGPKWQDQGFVFTTQKGGPLDPSQARKALDRMLVLAELPRIRFHDLRHTHATILLLNGVPVHVVAARLGDDPATLLRRYAHLLPSSQREAAEKFEAILGA